MTEPTTSTALTALSVYEVGDRQLFAVEAPFEMSRNNPEIIGQPVAVSWNGVALIGVVRGVDRHLPTGPIRKGEKIGLWVKPAGA